MKQLQDCSAYSYVARRAINLTRRARRRMEHVSLLLHYSSNSIPRLVRLFHTHNFFFWFVCFVVCVFFFFK